MPVANPPEHLFVEKHRRPRIIPNEESIIRLLGAVLLKQNDDRQIQHRTMPVEGMAELDTPQMEENSTLQITPAAA